LNYQLQVWIAGPSAHTLATSQDSVSSRTPHGMSIPIRAFSMACGTVVAL
jgi:hypothetical protein